MHEYKTCSKCKQVIDLKLFAKNKATKSGYGAICKSCFNARAREYNKRNPDKRLAREQKYHAKNPEKRKQLWAAYYAKNKKVLLEKQKEFANRNPEVVRAKYRKYKIANREQIVKKNKNYRDKNPQMHRAALQRRRTKIRQSGICKISSKEIAKLYSNRCFYCQSADKITLDHVVPISRGGRHSIGNLVAACSSCNSSKNNRFITEWKKL